MKRNEERKKGEFRYYYLVQKSLMQSRQAMNNPPRLLLGIHSFLFILEAVQCRGEPTFSINIHEEGIERNRMTIFLKSHRLSLSIGCMPSVICIDSFFRACANNWDKLHPFIDFFLANRNKLQYTHTHIRIHILGTATKSFPLVVEWRGTSIPSTYFFFIFYFCGCWWIRGRRCMDSLER